MLTSIATVSISGTLDEKLQAIAAAGYDGVEIFEADLLTSPRTPREIGGKIRDLGLECVLFQPFRDFEGMPEPWRTRAFDRAERKFALMNELGTDLLLICSNCSPHSLFDRGRIIDDFAALAERAERCGVRIGYEALAWGLHVNDHRDAWGIVRDVDHPAFGLILDSFHSLARRIPSASIGDIDARKLFMVQMADAPWLEMDYLTWARHFRNMPGQGDFPLTDYATQLQRIGYDGYWSLEIFNDRFRQGSCTGVALDGHRSLIALKDNVGRQPRAAARPTLTPRVTPTRIAFIEFAADDTEAQALKQTLTQLGFAAVGRHRRKAVERWSQGGINIVINREPDGFARSFDVVHGSSVCAIGLVVPDVAAALARAKALSIPDFEQSVGPGELRIPAVRGVGGSLIYFIEAGSEETVWDKEFAAVGDTSATAREIGLNQIDHIAQTTFYEEFMSWILYYVTLFDVTKTSQIHISDPLGLVQSQAVESANKTLRITLNSSGTQRTLSGRFLSKYSGAGVQHIALSCDDIFAAAERARDNGLETLEIPRNYYDDLAARFALDDELIGHMAALHILYDRDREAEYFQFYSRAVEKRVFFEIVERRNYNGYGAANAPIRLAAQSGFKTDGPY
ncbi:bifunctional sugar phosphate isomerase/epimerase/4-hydroxyphenylpyruvate dioxygenase family protein [Sphingobium xenophagum]|uniref:bifunctional sugar phosphate isomerase/epimerase/4-hydroxyphenylpyruvate dioxygenase family protein n=1 Tax=Sphingobium xenophagum TaxID=121428 RepID=UPI00036AFF1B|nr:sugar phosphate isomerase/epimerase and 4-hydroxyphenylpyruvate domain-containing protein [Sphingobium xenophagum]